MRDDRLCDDAVESIPSPISEKFVSGFSSAGAKVKIGFCFVPNPTRMASFID
jgi:hypothetical protein